MKGSDLILGNHGIPIMRMEPNIRFGELESILRRKFRGNFDESMLITVRGNLLASTITDADDILRDQKIFLFTKDFSEPHPFIPENLESENQSIISKFLGIGSTPSEQEKKLLSEISELSVFLYI